MQRLRGNAIFLRALEPEDLDFLATIENDESIWEISNTIQPYSKYVLKQYLNNSHQDLFEAKQLRLVICTNDQQKIGLVDLFDFDPINLRVGLGIIIKNTTDRGKGYGYEAVNLVINYIFERLQLHQVYVSVTNDNELSINLFTKLNFKKTGLKKDWIRTNNGYKDELSFQLINSKN